MNVKLIKAQKGAINHVLKTQACVLREGRALPSKSYLKSKALPLAEHIKAQKLERKSSRLYELKLFSLF
ncbi:hypothetical protein PNOK_0135000 [Pyrrhoderma noxium]|uniref:Uncharacterized protein n=1 Tax=Pyrrhoderma noxium TaxID=2282107 RepID=A0A286UXL0_9AGAM|nr:hypothetical protein PNOK_0135000 [Pyrrhoderma noxium]